LFLIDIKYLFIVHKINPKISPNIINIDGIIFISNGTKAILFLTGFNHIRTAPDTIAIDDRVNIGVLIWDSSFMEIQDLVCLGDIMVAMENRME
jgi:hypothetical protein